MSPLGRFIQRIDLHLVFLLLLLAPIAVGMAKFLPHGPRSWVWLLILGLMPQGLVLTRAGDLSRRGSEGRDYLLINELFLGLVTAVAGIFILG